MRERRRPPNDDARFIMEEDKPVLQKQEAIRLLFLRSKKCDWGTSRTTFPSSTEEKNATSGESAAVPCRARRPRRALQRGRMHPTGRMRIRPTACFRSVLLRGTPGTAFPTGRVRICRMWNQVIAVCCGGRPRAGRRPLQGRCVLSPISFPQRGKVASADPPRGG